MATACKHDGNFTRDGITTTAWTIFSDSPGMNYLDTHPELNEEDKRLFRDDICEWMRSTLRRNQESSDQEFQVNRDDKGRLTSVRVVFKSDQVGYGTTWSRKRVLKTLSGFLFENPAT